MEEKKDFKGRPTNVGLKKEAEYCEFRLPYELKWRSCEPLHDKMSNILFWWTEDFDAWSTAWLTPCTRLWRAATAKTTAAFCQLMAHLAFQITTVSNLEKQSWIKINTMCNYWLLHHEKYMWAWSRGLQNTDPALASAHHIRQQIVKEK